ncbi:MAG: hypothetical protein K6A28_01020, partial [Bacteroidales bacterium]|nr:hypothetical protein [Bacteroidales bacterium]
MKKALLLLSCLFLVMGIQAQWSDNHQTNTFIANAGDEAEEVYISTDPVSGDTYIQWTGSYSNGWSPSLQRLDFEGRPQWGDDGIHIGAYEFASWSQGISMAATTDNAVVTCFADYEGYTYAVKINADGTFAWGEQGVQLFDGHGFSRTELVAGDDGGVWALGSDYDNSYVQYVNADGTLNDYNTISSDASCIFGQLTLSDDNNVFVTYEKVGSGMYTEKEIHVVGFQPDGFQISQDVRLMAPQTFQSTYIHNVVPDGMGGGYAYIYHPGIGEAFNVYVFHFDKNGVSTISDPNGATVHSMNPACHYAYPFVSVDPVSHDLLVSYIETDVTTQSQCLVYINRITSTGERVWGDGIMILDATYTPTSTMIIDAYEDGSGFSVVGEIGADLNADNTTVKAFGFDMNGNATWTTIMSSNVYPKAFCEQSTGYHQGQNIVAWVNADTGGIYGQNIQPDGVMGVVQPPVEVPGPVNFVGEYVFDMESNLFGVQLEWMTIINELVSKYYLHRT